MEDSLGEDLLTLPEVASMVGVHRATINTMVRRGKLPATRKGSAWLVDRSVAVGLRDSYHRPPNSPIPRPPGALAPPRQELLEALDQLGEATVSELGRVVCLHEGNIRKNLLVLQQRSLAYRDEEGNWTLTPLGRASVLSQPV